MVIKKLLYLSDYFLLLGQLGKSLAYILNTFFICKHDLNKRHTVFGQGVGRGYGGEKKSSTGCTLKTTHTTGNKFLAELFKTRLTLILRQTSRPP